jgi:hypothetical protein
VAEFHFGAVTPVGQHWVAGTMGVPDLSTAETYYRLYSRDGSLPALGDPIDHMVGKGPDGRSIAALFFKSK